MNSASLTDIQFETLCDLRNMLRELDERTPGDPAVVDMHYRVTKLKEKLRRSGMSEDSMDDYL